MTKRKIPEHRVIYHDPVVKMTVTIIKEDGFWPVLEGQIIAAFTPVDDHTQIIHGQKRESGAG